MPVRSLNSPVMRWPDRDAVVRAVTQWARGAARAHPEVVRIGIIGSYARGNWGVGSDVDILVELGACETPFERRALHLPEANLPVPEEILVYTTDELRRMRDDHNPFIAEADRVVLWVFPRDPDDRAAPPGRPSATR